MSAGLHTRAGEAMHRRPLFIGLIVLAVLIVAVIGWRAVQASDDESCESISSARLAASPDIAPALTELAEGLEDEGRCVSIDVESVPADEVLNQLSTQSGDAPDLWVPDSEVWARQLAQNGVDAETISPAIASSPVVLVGGPAAETTDSWLSAVSSGEVVMQAPTVSTPSALALIAPRAERKQSGATEKQIGAGLVTAAQHYGEQSSTKPVADVLAAITASSKRLVPVTEQQFLQARRTNSSLTVSVPKTGTMIQDYPLLALPGRSAEANTALGQLFDYLQRPQGSVALADHDFRPANGDPLPGDRGVGKVSELPAPGADAAAKDLRSWQVLAVPSSMLVVLDASGSMDFQTGAGTRMELAAGAARRALGAFPGNARIGMWLFSVDQGGPGVDPVLLYTS
ncbi:MAG: substrate-binding and VWA domain-containing protein, partial [Nocardioides sp.]|nr:substrate-binding and VWA domain-containing protein [Nocardioides sp.]